MFWKIKALRKSIWRRLGKDQGGARENHYILKGSMISCFLFLIVGCQSDISVSDKKNTNVIIDSYVQSEQLGELDVLIVLDTSGSMSDNYDDVGDGMDILRSNIESLTLDYRFGYITMDPNEPAYTGPYDLSSTAIDMLMAPSLLPMTTLEEGFSATYKFLNSEEGYEFRRPAADFLLFLISDEDEQSSITADLFYEWLSDEFKDVNHDVVCIANSDNELTGWGNSTGHEYIHLSNLYNKDLIDITEEDWSVWLSESSYLTKRIDYIRLSNPDPLIESIIVYVDQIKTEGWNYIEETNTVYLDVIPDYGAIVEVGYNVYEN